MNAACRMNDCNLTNDCKRTNDCCGRIIKKIYTDMKIITYNVNGLRAAVSKGLPEWLAKEQPDVLCLQETKLQPEQYPAEALDVLGYRHYLHSARRKGIAESPS